MKKRIALCLMMSCLTAAALSGCNAGKIRKTVNSTDVSEDVNEEESNEETVENDDSGYPVLGQEDIDDYEGFKYLYCEKLRTESEKNEKTGKMESKELEVFVPIDDYVSVSRNYVMVDKYGISFSLRLNPYIRYGKDDYLIGENLEYYMESSLDTAYTDKYMDIVMSDVEEVDENTAYATAEYCLYDRYNDDYSAVFSTLLLKKLENDVTVILEIEVNSEDVTGKAPKLIEELEEFYEIEINWDKERAEKKLEDFLGKGGDRTISDGYISFELPEGWSKDSYESEFSTYVYAPDGDAAEANCFLSINKEYLDSSDYIDIDTLEDNQDEIIALVKEIIEEDGTTADVSYYGKTDLGLVVKAEIEEVDEDEVITTIHAYWIFNEDYVHTILAVQYGDEAKGDPFAVAENILNNGRVV